MISFVAGSDVDIAVRLQDASTSNPFDMTGVTYIRACFVNADLSSLYQYYLSIVGDLAIGSPIVTNTDTTYVVPGQLVTDANVPPGTTVLTVDSPTQFTMTANASNNALVEPLILGTITIDPVLTIGKFTIHLLSAETALLQTTTATGNIQNFEVRLSRNNFLSYVQFPNSLQINAPFC